MAAYSRLLFSAAALLTFSTLLHASTNEQVPFQEFTDKQIASIEKATKWLLKAQNNDGSWGLDQKTTGDITCTALSVMALMSSGSSEREGADEQSVWR